MCANKRKQISVSVNPSHLVIRTNKPSLNILAMNKTMVTAKGLDYFYAG